VVLTATSHDTSFNKKFQMTVAKPEIIVNQRERCADVTFHCQFICFREFTTWRRFEWLMWLVFNAWKFNMAVLRPDEVVAQNVFKIYVKFQLLYTCFRALQFNDTKFDIFTSCLLRCMKLNVAAVKPEAP
jgi:hypothetical protein